jgi:hypothetical protein
MSHQWTHVALSVKGEDKQMATTIDTTSRTQDVGVRGRGEIMEGGRWVACAAFVYVAAWLIGLIMGFASSSPSPTDSAQKIGTYFASHREAAMIQAYFLDGIAGIALVALAATLRTAFRRFESTRTMLSNILFGAGVAAGTVSLIQGLFTQVLADRVAKLGNPAAIRTLYDLNTEGDTYKLLAIGVFLAAASFLVFRTNALPRWIAWFGMVLAPLLVISGWNFVLSTDAQYAAYAVLLLALLVWSGAVGVTSWMRTD